MTEPTLELKNVTKRYKRHTAVADLDLSIDPGERIALLGHNGAGKTTIMKLVLGLTKLSAGTIKVLGQDPALSKAADSRRAIGFLPETVHFHDAMTGLETLTFYARLKNIAVNEVGDLLDQVGLAGAADRRVKTYSKGMRQRLGLAQALLGHPKLLLLDEPTTGLDPILRTSFYDLMEVMAARGTTVLLSSHALSEIAAKTDRIAILSEGRLVALGSIQELYTQAGLPIRFYIKAPDGEAPAMMDRLGSDSNIVRCNGRSFEIACPESEKMTFLRRIVELGLNIQDVDIHKPTLDDLYAHFGSVDHGDGAER